MKYLRAVTIGALSLVFAASARAQLPSQAQLQQLQALAQQPGGADSITALIARSGLSADQIRAKLQAAGYPTGLLDQYLPGGAPGTQAAAPGSAELAGLQAIGLPFAAAAQAVPVQAGFVTPSGPDHDSSRVFGVDALRRSTTQFLPTLAGPVPPDYRLGPGDELVLILTGDVELTYQLGVSREGFIVIPQVGQLYVANLTLDQLDDVLYTRLHKSYSGVRRGQGATTKFSVSVASVRTNQVYVTGEVTQPGAYQISALGTVLTSLYAAGGVTGRADMRHIFVRRLGKVVGTMDLYDYLLRGDTKSDIRLETGDVIFVPVHGPRVDIEGAVIRPGIYELAPGEDLRFVISAAGGLRADAARQRLTVFRLLPTSQQGPGAAPRAAINVPLLPDTQSVDTTRGVSIIPPLALTAGDSIAVDFVPPLENTYYVSIDGMVRRPGTFPWREGMTMHQLVTLAGGPIAGADLRSAEVARMPADRSTGQLATIVRAPLDSSYLLDRDSLGRYAGPPGPAFPPAGSAAPFPLQPFDHVLILRQPEYQTPRLVSLTGKVTFPGAYAITSEDERLSDLIRRAGGLLPSAYPPGTQFIRALDGAGRVNIDLSSALAHPDGEHDIVLQAGDSIHVPQYSPVVRVVGAVNSAVSVMYKPGADVDYYLDNAGGLMRNADEGRLSVRFADGSAEVTHRRALFWHWHPTPGPGSTVFVPSKPESEPLNTTQFLGNLAQILASSVAILVLATRL